MADQLWSAAIKDDWAHRCAICGRRGDLNSHHLIPRQHAATRFDLQNGICLCRHCHQFCPNRSPHQNAAGFMLWLEADFPASAKWYRETMKSHAYRNSGVTTNAAYYIAVIRSLKQYADENDYTRIVGQRFGAWLERG